MAPPPPNECPVDGCPYKTPATLPNYDLVYRDLDIHTKYSHINLIPAKAPRHTEEASAAKADKLPRPELKEGATEADYIYLKTRGQDTNTPLVCQAKQLLTNYGPAAPLSSAGQCMTVV